MSIIWCQKHNHYSGNKEKSDISITVRASGKNGKDERQIAARFGITMRNNVMAQISGTGYVMVGLDPSKNRLYLAEGNEKSGYKSCYSYKDKIPQNKDIQYIQLQPGKDHMVEEWLLKNIGDYSLCFDERRMAYISPDEKEIIWVQRPR